jgi:hypothetical protein
MYNEILKAYAYVSMIIQPLQGCDILELLVYSR